VPVVLANARLSERSLRKARKLGSLMADAARGISLVAAQTEDDANRVRALGVANVAVTGSIKFDVAVPPAALATGTQLKNQFGAGRPVLLCASTREGEEEQILDAFKAAALPQGTLLLLVPRHPQRFDAVEAMVRERSLAVQRRSTLAQPGARVDAATRVVLGDSMGEMFAYYATCDIAFIGGSLAPLGGQNLIEAAALGKPVLIGQHTFNFAQVTEDAVAAGGALRVNDAADLMAQAARLLADDAARNAMGHAGLAFANRHRGATARTIELLPPLAE